MNLSRTLMIAAVTTVAATPTQSALAGRHAAPAASAAAATFRIIGEPKNEPPFTNQVDPPILVGEPKNEPPFTNRVVEREATRERANAMTTSHASAGASDALDRYLGNK